MIDNLCIALFSGVPKLTAPYKILQHFLSFTNIIQITVIIVSIVVIITVIIVSIVVIITVIIVSIVVIITVIIVRISIIVLSLFQPLLWSLFLSLESSLLSLSSSQ